MSPSVTLSSVPKYKNACCEAFMVKICMLDKLCSVISYSAFGHEFNGNETIAYYNEVILKWKERSCIDWLTKLL